MHENLISPPGDSPFHAFLNNKGRNSFWSSCHIGLCIYNLQKGIGQSVCFPNAARTKILSGLKKSIPWWRKGAYTKYEWHALIVIGKTNLWHTGFLVFNTMRCCYSYVQTSLMSRFKLTNVSAMGPFVHHILLPFKIYPPWVRSALHFMLTTSEPAVSCLTKYQKKSI